MQYLHQVRALLLYVKSSCQIPSLHAHGRNVIGVIDSTHIRIHPPGASKAPTYYNGNKQFFSILHIAIVNNAGKFRWFASGAPGSSTDSGVFQTCTSFYRDIVGERNQPVGERKLIANEGCILGGSGFAETPWMRTLVAAPKTREGRYFNCKHSNLRFRAEHVFGRLKSKFQALQNGLLFDLDHAPVIINACTILHHPIQFSRCMKGRTPVSYTHLTLPTICSV